MSLARERVLGALELRYDYYSARAVLADALADARLSDKPEFSADEIGTLCAIFATDPRKNVIVERLRRWAGLEGEQPQPPTTPPETARAAVAPQPPPPEPKPPAPAAPVSEAKPAEVATPAAPQPPPAAPQVSVAETPAAVPAREAQAPAPAPAERAGADAPAQPEADVVANQTGTGVHADTGEAEIAAEAPNEHDVVPPPTPATALDGAHVEGVEVGAAVDLTIRLAGVPAESGAMVVMVGNLSVLGEWVPDQGVILEEDGEHWTASIQVPLGSTLEFKFVCMGDASSLWEGGPNRSLAIAPGTRTLETVWQA